MKKMIKAISLIIKLGICMVALLSILSLFNMKAIFSKDKGIIEPYKIKNKFSQDFDIRNQIQAAALLQS